MTHKKEKAMVPELRFCEFSEKWQEKYLGDIAKVERGKFTPRPRNNPKYYGGSIPFVQTGDVVKAELYLKKFSQTLNELGLSVSRIFPENTILMSIAANIGDVVILKFPVACPDSLVGILANKECDYLWLYYELSKKKDKLLTYATTNAQANINLEILRPLKIFTPSEKKEQKKISIFLNTIDKKIDQLRQKYDYLQTYKNGVVQKIFSQKIRFPENYYLQNWKDKKLGKLTIKTGIKNKSSIRYPVYSINNKEGFLPQSDQFEGMDSNKRGYDISMYKIIGKRTFAYNPSRINVGSIGYNKELENIIVSSLYVCFKTTSELNEQYLLKYINTYKFNKSVLRNIEGGVRECLFYDNFSNIIIPLPSYEEQHKIANFLSTLDKKIDLINQKITEMKTFKKGLLQKMFV